MSDIEKKLKFKPRKSIILDKINPQDYLKINLIYCCEQCTHFNSESIQCSLGYPVANHLKAEQEKCYELTGKMALCRFLEID